MPSGRPFCGLENGRLGGLKNAIEPPHDDEGQDYFAVFGLLEVAPQDFRNRPSE